MKTVTVYLGSNFGDSVAYQEAAAALGSELARRALHLVYGGTRKGLMGILADAALAAGGTVTGVITHRLRDKGHLHPGLANVETVTGMRERKQRMAQLADAFIVLPGGVGTMEEFFETWTMQQLEGHTKPLGLLNINGFYDGLVAFVDHMIGRQFLPATHRQMILLDDDPARLLDRCAEFHPVTASKWL